MSMYGEYIKEHRGDEIIDSEKGFAAYRYLGEKSVYIFDLWVHPSYRKHGYASALADMVVGIAKQRGCTELLGTVCCGLDEKKVNERILVLIHYGMTALTAQNNIITFRKDI